MDSGCFYDTTVQNKQQTLKHDDCNVCPSVCPGGDELFGPVRWVTTAEERARDNRLYAGKMGYKHRDEEEEKISRCRLYKTITKYHVKDLRGSGAILNLGESSEKEAVWADMLAITANCAYTCVKCVFPTLRKPGTSQTGALKTYYIILTEAFITAKPLQIYLDCCLRVLKKTSNA